MTKKLPIELKRRLVKRAEAIAWEVRSEKNQASQLRNLLQISQTETEVLVLTNFIRYQAARRATKAFWRRIHADVVDMLEEIERKTGDDAALRGMAIQHFFGYLIRAYVYVTSPARHDKPKEVADADA